MSANPPSDVMQQAEAALRALDTAAAPDADTQRARAHRSLWLAHKARGEFEAALRHCEAWIALAGPAPGEDLPAADDAAAVAVPPALVTLLEQARQRRKPMALAALAVADAAALRKQHGNGVADTVEREVAQLLRLRLRARDLALPWTEARWLVALVDTPPAAAAAICDRLRAAVQHHDWDFVAAGLQVTVALGLVTDVADASPASALQRADAALKRAR